jgi:hypothetical protein
MLFANMVLEPSAILLKLDVPWGASSTRSVGSFIFHAIEPQQLPVKQTPVRISTALQVLQRDSASCTHVGGLQDKCGH